MNEGIKFEAIKPPKFNANMRPYIYRGMRRTAYMVVKEYNRTVEHWKRKPVFRESLRTAGDIISVSVYTNNPIYPFVDFGVWAHPIYPRHIRARISNVGGSVWRTDTVIQKKVVAGTYNAGSTPGVISTNPSGKPRDDGRVLSLNWVIPWSGIEPRRFTESIGELIVDEGNYNSMQKNIEIELQKYSEDAWRKS